MTISSEMIGSGEPATTQHQHVRPSRSERRPSRDLRPPAGDGGGGGEGAFCAPLYGEGPPAGIIRRDRAEVERFEVVLEGRGGHAGPVMALRLMLKKALRLGLKCRSARRIINTGERT